SAFGCTSEGSIPGDHPKNKREAQCNALLAENTTASGHSGDLEPFTRSARSQPPCDEAGNWGRKGYASALSKSPGGAFGVRRFIAALLPRTKAVMNRRTPKQPPR